LDGLLERYNDEEDDFADFCAELDALGFLPLDEVTLILTVTQRNLKKYFFRSSTGFESSRREQLLKVMRVKRRYASILVRHTCLDDLAAD